MLNLNTSNKDYSSDTPPIKVVAIRESNFRLYNFKSFWSNFNFLVSSIENTLLVQIQLVILTKKKINKKNPVAHIWLVK